jgi:hypothetical protein
VGDVRYGDEHKLAGFSATLQAIMSYVESSGDSIHSIRAGAHKVCSLLLSLADFPDYGSQ